MSSRYRFYFAFYYITVYNTSQRRNDAFVCLISKKQWPRKVLKRPLRSSNHFQNNLFESRDIYSHYFAPNYSFFAPRDSRHKLKSLEAEIEVYKKSIIKEEERNELLASILNRSENDANTSRKLIAQNLSKQDAMKVEFGAYTRTLQETEQALNRATAVRFPD